MFLIHNLQYQDLIFNYFLYVCDMTITHICGIVSMIRHNSKFYLTCGHYEKDSKHAEPFRLDKDL